MDRGVALIGITHQGGSERIRNVPAGTSFVVNHLQGLGYIAIQEHVHNKAWNAPLRGRTQLRCTVQIRP